jgi:phospholipase/carboxylesterase
MLDVFEVEPTEPLRGSVIWMHGLGATNHDFDDVVPELDTPYLRYVFPAAPVRAVTINGGMAMPAWYDILTFQDPPLRESERDVRDAAVDVSSLIHREIDRGVPSQQIVLAGFSQGGAMALHVGLRERQTLAGIVVLSGYMVLPQAFDAERSPSNAKTPLFMAHGTLDPTVPLGLYRQAVQTLRAAKYEVNAHEYRMGHSLCMPEVADLRQWLQARFAEAP